ncbi:AAA family ATPase [Thiomonas bhubaneswarensis]|uniref:AAA family ATPase n=1 Tax=Thiomonas bhubaneswarensis TaxID=339866 RepID=UPI000930B3AF|nr:AAA family ATPase [Thiomonas bhubaneswarensis]
MYGPPGTGKTSLVTALASELRLNVCTLSLASPVVTDEKIHTLLAAVLQRSLLLIEDVDAFFHQRDAAHTQVRLSFSGFLNALDGVATQEGNVLFMTTNHIDRLDEALIRAGRIDERVALDVCDEDQLRRLYLKFHADPQAAAQFAREHAVQHLAAAQVQGLLMRRFGAVPREPEQAVLAQTTV